MATFSVDVFPVVIQPHENADSLEIALIAGYKSIVLKGRYKTGDLVAYIPEGSVVPDSIIEEMGLTGKLSGPKKNVVRAVRLRGIFSQGICYPARPEWAEGQNVADVLGIIKYEPEPPGHLRGEVNSIPIELRFKYDINNLKRYPDLFQDGEMVVMTEKCHGTFTVIGLMTPDFTKSGEIETLVSSKGLFGSGLIFKTEEGKNERNVYVRMVHKLNPVERIQNVFGHNNVVYILGEIFGTGVQDLQYNQATPTFRIFDIFVGTPHNGRFLNDDELEQACKDLDIPRVPVLYRGPFSNEMVATHTNGFETISGNQVHIREGVVIRPVVERKMENIDLPCWGRVQLKSISESYLLRKGNVTEFQ